MRLTDAERTPGSRCRADMKGDILFAMYAYDRVEALIRPDACIIHDTWLEDNRAYLPQDAAAAYEERLSRLIAEQPEGSPFEQINHRICSLRRVCFSGAFERCRAREASAGTLPDAAAGIDQTAVFERRLAACDGVMFVPSDMRLAGLLDADARWARRLGKRCFLACDRGSCPELPKAETLAKALRPGFEPVRLEGCLDALDVMREDFGRFSGSLLIVWYGETGLSSCRSLAWPAVVRCVPRSLPARAIAGQMLSNALCTIDVPPHFDILPWVPLRRRTLANYRVFAYLRERYGEAVYTMDPRELYAKTPEAFFSVYDETGFGLPDGLEWRVSSDDPDWYARWCSDRESMLEAYIGSLPGVRAVKGWYEYDTFISKPVPWTASGEPAGVLVHGILVDAVDSASVILAEGKPISPRLMVADTEPSAEVRLISNYLFFLTPRLADLYNRLRQDRPEEQIAVRGGHLDYMLKCECGDRIETFPLYNKACMGLDGNGRFVFFHFRLAGGRCRLNGFELAWSTEDVDPAEPGEIAVYTPYYSRGYVCPAYRDFVLPVGAGRINVVVVQSTVVCIRRGDVLLPPMGVVISLDENKGSALVRSLGLCFNDSGYADGVPRIHIKVRLDPPKGFDADRWSGMRWAYGGGLTLIRGGRDVLVPGDDQFRTLDEEGWNCPLSRQTQESDIAAMVRHPRTAIGVTSKGKLFILVWSGRSAVSGGADYIEMCATARRLIPDIREMMNVDGGGSAVLGIAPGNSFFEYSWPSTSPDSVYGMVRPVNSMLCIAIKS